MSLGLSLLVGFVAFLHVWFLVLEMFLWTKPIGMKLMRMSQDKADASAVLAANQGLYNGFLAAGLMMSLVVSDPAVAQNFRNFFLICVSVAGIYGGLSFSRRIFYIQGIPALIALAMTFL